MNWIKKKVIKWVREDWESENKKHRYDATPQVVCDDHYVDTQKYFTVKVQTATGGRIVSFNHYDRKLDRGDTTVYVVPEEQNFNDALVKLINLESYR